jgi:uncharacterized protein YndB with AHSA1/START domain
MISVAAHTTIACPPARVFAILDDFARASEWNERCVAIEQVGPGEHAPGTKLVYRYRFREHGREGAISGEISDYRRDTALAMHYADHAFDIRVRFELVPHEGGTKLVHEADIELKTLVVKLMAPLLRGAARRQTESIVQRLRAIAERP